MSCSSAPTWTIRSSAEQSERSSRDSWQSFKSGSSLADNEPSKGDTEPRTYSDAVALPHNHHYSIQTEDGAFLDVTKQASQVSFRRVSAS